jgi:hypothetical protein
VIVYGNILSLIQWIATGTIFSALLLDSIFAKKSSSNDAEIESAPEFVAMTMKPNESNNVV